jgi:hypothetical protein
MKFVLSWFICFACISAIAQEQVHPSLSFRGYGETYYSYDFSEPANHEKPAFLYNHKRHNELNFNLILAQANLSHESYRAQLGIMAGNYAQYNLSAEPNWAQLIYEANIGVKLSRQHALWLDAGVMPSHIGFESAIGADCWTLSRGIYAENSPYYEAGARLSYTSKNEKLLLAGYYLNGWQRIQKPNGIQKPSFGMQLNYKPSQSVILNYSNFVGTDKPDSLSALRIFHNVYMQFEPSEKWGIIAGFDWGTEKMGASSFQHWYTPVIIIRKAWGDHVKTALRGEYYSDKNQIIISTGTTHGFQTLGISANIDYDVNEKVKLRLEGKWYSSQDAIFDEGTQRQNTSMTTSLCIRL